MSMKIKMELLLLILFVSCSGQLQFEEKNLNFAFNYAENNRAELEKVLIHYKNDSLKQEAAKFLIRNMPACFSYQQGGDMDSVKYALTLTDSHHYLEPNIIQKWNIYYYPGLPKIYDAKIITSEYLIDNIDRAFKQWQKRPWGKYLSFEDFCEYILPYRVGNEPLENWRKLYEDSFSFLLDSVYTGSDIIEATNLLKEYLKEPQFRHCTAFNLPNLGPLYLFYNRFGNCADYADLFTYACRSIGIPCVEETNVRNYHTWNVIKDTTDLDIPCWYDTWMIYRGDKKVGDFRCGKVYRKTYEMQIDEVKKYTTEEWDKLYPYYKNPYQKDVSHSYYRDTLVLAQDKEHEKNFIYLSFFSVNRWWSCGVTKPKNKLIQFEHVEPNVVYALHDYQKGQYKQISYPFLFNEGKTRFFESDTTKFKRIKLYRKYPPSDWTFYYLQQVRGAVFEASNSKSFVNKELLHKIIDKPLIAYNSVPLSKPVKYRYIRYQTKDNQIVELGGINLYYQGKLIKPQHAFGSMPDDVKPISDPLNIIDDDPLTYFTTKQPGSQVTIDLGEPKMIDRIDFYPHNDDNFIRRGDMYELFYNGGEKGWVSLGKQVADTAYLEYNIPDNAYLLLKNYTRGKEEQGFYLDGDKQIFAIAP